MVTLREPVTQATLKVVGAFHGLSRERSDARKYPAIDPMESWSKYPGVLNPEAVDFVRKVLFRGSEIEAMMKVVGEEGTAINDYVVYLKSDLIDAVYLQQNSFDPVDAAVIVDRQKHVFAFILDIVGSEFSFADKNEARTYFNTLRQAFIDYNGVEWQTDEFFKREKAMVETLNEKKVGLDSTAAELLKVGV